MKGVYAALAVLCAAGCTPPTVVNLNDGYNHLAKGGKFPCNGQPTAVDSNHKDVILEGGCRTVRVAGSHVDLVAYVEPGATIEVTGSHDTIVYRQVQRGAAPRWIDQGAGNELLRNSRFGSDQDHDWWQQPR